MAEKSRFSIFGFRIGKKDKDGNDQAVQPSFVPPSNEDGAYTVTSAAQFGTAAIDMDGSAKNEIELITRYREMAMQPEVESAIEDIVNEAIVRDDDGKSIEIVLDDLKQPDKIKKAISEEFETIIKLLNYYNMGSDIFRRYYIDGRLFYHIVIDLQNPQRGIQELRYIDPRKIKKIREVKKQKDTVTGIEVITQTTEYYVFSDKMTTGASSPMSSTVGGIKIAPDSIINVNSGLMDSRRGMSLSYLHKAIKPLNQLRMIEDAVVIYRLSRAPERRVFYIDVGNLPRIKAEQYVRDIMTKYKNKLVYDGQTGEIRDDRRHLAMTEDFWMPRRCLSLNTKIKLLDGRDETLENLIKEYEGGKQNWTYSVAPDGSIVPGKISWAGITRKDAKIVRVELDNGEFIECTPDHKFILRDGSLCEAQNLNENQSLMPLYTNADEYKRGCNYNHKVISVTFLEKKQDTGTLTIDENHEIHGYHNFGLSCGIFVKNSDNKSTEITTLPGGCFSMDTKVSLLDGRECSIREIESELNIGKELWTYSCEPKNGKIVPGLISWAGVTQKSAKVMELTLDNGEIITCTPEHKFPIYDQQYKEAKDFVVGESLIPLYKRKTPLSKNSTLEYEEYFDNEEKVWKFTHRTVSDYLKDVGVNYNTYNEDFSDGKYDVRHHINFNRFDNSPNNLCFMSWRDHSKLHQDNIKLLHEREDYIENLKFGVNKYYENRTDEEKQEHSNRSKDIWTKFSNEEYKNVCSKISIGMKTFCDNLDDEAKHLRAERCLNNSSLGGQAYSEKLKNDEDFRNYICDIRKSVWTDQRKLETAKTFSEFNKKRWEDETTRITHREQQKVIFSHDMLLFTIDLVKGKTTHQVTLCNVLNELNNNSELLDQLKNLNSDKSVPNWCINDGFTATLIPKMVKQFGYESWKDFRIKESLHNHRIVKIRYLEDPIEVGTLTIDFNEHYHNYHTFALSCGVFTFNSNLGQMEDVNYFERKLYKSLNVPVSRLDPSQLPVSIGRSNEITRDELKFSKFVEKLRYKFAELFDQALRIQLVLKGICTEEEWKEFNEKISYDFIKDNNFAELKEAEMMQERLGVLAIVDQYSGKYYSKRWIQQHILRLNDQEIEEMEDEIQEEKQVDFHQQTEDQERQILLQKQASDFQEKVNPQQNQQVGGQEQGQEQEVEQPEEQEETAQQPVKRNTNPYNI